MVIGWDIGGVNTKVARVTAGEILAVREEPFELQRQPEALVAVLQRLARSVGSDEPATQAVTMTAELSQMFRTKREGVSFVLDAVERAFPGDDVRVFSVRDGFVTAAEARARPLAVAASNWMATAMMVASQRQDALLIDVGTTTTDLIPLVHGRVAAEGATDLERLASRELVYTGLLRTPVEAVTDRVTLHGQPVGVSAEGFALIGDVHLWRGDLVEADYTVPAPDGRPATREYAAERLCRFVCADREMLRDEDISVIADDVARAQRERLVEAILTVGARHPSVRRAVVTGRGAFIAAAAARAAGFDVEWLESEIGFDGARSAPAVAVALLCEGRDLRPDSAAWERGGSLRRPTPREPDSYPPEMVIKIGGGSLQAMGALDAALVVLNAAIGCRCVVVPGGGPFADAVREVDRRVSLSDGAAHWMAIRAMDQCAELLASRLERGVLVQTPAGIRDAIRSGRIPVLAPFQWLRSADALPHSWDVTSDSIAAWVAGELGIPQLVLVKPSASRTGVDQFFTQARPAGLRVAAVGVEEISRLATLLQSGADAG